MALVQCDECGRQVSNLAKACPGCGAPPQSARTSEEPLKGDSVPPSSLERLQPFILTEGIAAQLLVAPHGRSLYVGSRIPEAKIRGALTSYTGELEQGESPVALLDATIFGSATDGMLFTSHAVYWKDSLSKATGTVRYGDLRSATYLGNPLTMKASVNGVQFSLSGSHPDSARAAIALASGIVTRRAQATGTRGSPATPQGLSESRAPSQPLVPLPQEGRLSFFSLGSLDAEPATGVDSLGSIVRVPSLRMELPPSSVGTPALERAHHGASHAIASVGASRSVLPPRQLTTPANLPVHQPLGFWRGSGAWASLCYIAAVIQTLFALNPSATRSVRPSSAEDMILALEHCGSHSLTGCEIPASVEVRLLWILAGAGFFFLGRHLRRKNLRRLGQL